MTLSSIKTSPTKYRLFFTLPFFFIMSGCAHVGDVILSKPVASLCNIMPQNFCADFLEEAVKGIFGDDVAEAIFIVEVDYFEQVRIVQLYLFTREMVQASVERISKAMTIAQSVLASNNEKAQKLVNDINRISDLRGGISGIEGLREFTRNMDELAKEISSDADALFKRIKEKEFSLSPEEKRRLNEGYRQWVAGSVYQAYATRGLLNFDNALEPGSIGEISQALTAREEKISEEDVESSFNDLGTFAFNYIDVVRLFLKLADAGDLTGINRARDDIIRAQQEENIANTARRLGLKGRRVATLGGNYENLQEIPPNADRRVYEIQSMLKSQGYDPGPIDGQMGPRTRQAIRKFEADTDRPVTGQASSEVSAALRRLERQ